MDSPARPASGSTFGAEARLSSDIPCRGCGYNLRGALPDGVCPECATPVRRSIHGDLLQFCDPAWIDRLSSGTNYITAAVAAGVLSLCVCPGTMRSSVSGELGLVILFAPAITAVSILAVGIWRITTPSPVRVAETHWSARRLVRATLVFALALFLLLLLARRWPAFVHEILLLVCGAVIAVGALCMFTHAQALANRIPDPSLAHETRLVKWGTCGCMALIVLTQIVAGALRRVPSACELPEPAAFVIGVVAVCGLAIFGIWSLRLIDRFRRALRWAARDARRTWASSA